MRNRNGKTMQEIYLKAMDAAVNYLSYRARPAAKVAEYLEKKGFDEHIIAQVMERLTENHLVDDDALAKRYVELHKGNDGRFLLRQKLKKMGLEQDVIDRSVSGLSHQEQVEAARQLLEKKLKTDERPDALRRAMQSVLRRGYPYDVVRAAAEDYRAQLEEEEWESD